MCYKDVPAPNGFQHCPHCRETKPVGDFEPTERRPCGRTQRCLICLTEYRSCLRTIRSINDGSVLSLATASPPPAALAALLTSDIPLDDLG